MRLLLLLLLMLMLMTPGTCYGQKDSDKLRYLFSGSTETYNVRYYQGILLGKRIAVYKKSDKHYLKLDECKEREWALQKTKATLYKIRPPKDVPTSWRQNPLLVVLKKPNGKRMTVKWTELSRRDRKYIVTEVHKIILRVSK